MREYYKTRNRLDENWRTHIQRDMGAEGGIVVDAMLTFFRKDQSPFQVALEASSYDKMPEVRYAPQPMLLRWDSLALAAGSTSLLFGLWYVLQPGVVGRIGLWTTALLLWILFFLLYFSARRLLRPLSRYRYIYAIRQFQQYYADEQWVALGADVFDEAGNPYFRELRRQCVQYGIGLLLVNSKLQTQLVLSPSRTDAFRSKRRVLTFLPQVDFRPVQRRWSKGLSFFRKATEPLLQGLPHYNRFRRTYYHQIGWLLASLSVVGGLLWYEFTNPPVRYVNEERHRREMEREALYAQPETPRYYLDTQAISPFVELKHAYLDVEQIQAREAESGVEIRRQEGRVEIYIPSTGERTIAYDCSRLRFEERMYYVSAGTWYNLQDALRVTRGLKAAGLPAGFFWRGCFGPQRGYTIFIELFFEERSAAEELLRRVEGHARRETLNEHSLPEVDFRVAGIRRR